MSSCGKAGCREWVGGGLAGPMGPVAREQASVSCLTELLTSSLCVALGLWGGRREGFGHVGVGCYHEPQHRMWAVDPCMESWGTELQRSPAIWARMSYKWSTMQAVIFMSGMRRGQRVDHCRSGLSEWE